MTKVGPVVNQEMVKKVMAYKEKGLSMREIAKLLGKDVKSVYRWYDYGIGRKKYVKTDTHYRKGKKGA